MNASNLGHSEYRKLMYGLVINHCSINALVYLLMNLMVSCNRHNDKNVPR